MGGALKGIFGGGGIFGALLSVASMMFPPLAIASSLTNLLTQTLGQALKAGIDMLMQQFGMPKFIGNLAKDIIDKVISQNQKPSEPAVDNAVQQQAGDAAKAWGTDFTKDFVEKTLEKIKKRDGKSPAEGKVTAGSWLEAIALAMADAMANKANKMIDLSDQIRDLSSKKIDQKDTNAQKENAGQLQVANAQLNAAGKEFELLTNTMKSVVDSIGNSLAQAARKS
jgi:hypothetical protein